MTKSIGSLGYFFGPIFLLLSFTLVALVMMNVLQIRRDVLLPPEFVDDFEAQLDNKDYQGAYNTARDHDSMVARVLTAGLTKLEARLFQHELDHLDGVLIVDHLDEDQLREAKRFLRERTLAAEMPGPSGGGLRLS